MTKKLEIIFPIYKDHEMFDRALKALADQTFKDFRVIVMDDTSPVGYEDAIAPYKDKLDIVIKRNPKNLGAMPNMWQSRQYPTESPYIFPLHADDFIKADYLERAIEILEKHQDVSYVLTDPEWVPAGITYVRSVIGTTDYYTFDAADFAKNILNFAPYMSGSTIYRSTDRIADWEYDRFYTFCDRFYLGKILSTNNSKGAFLKGKGIYEHDHSLDKEDKRTDGAAEIHFMELLAFYRDLLVKKYPQKQVEKIITNSTVYYYSNFPDRIPFLKFIEKQKQFNLIHFLQIRSLGIFSLLTLPLSQKSKLKVIQTIKKWLPNKNSV